MTSTGNNGTYAMYEKNVRGFLVTQFGIRCRGEAKTQDRCRSPPNQPVVAGVRKEEGDRDVCDRDGPAPAAPESVIGASVS